MPGGDDATRLFFSPDVLVMTIPIIGRYPSVNNVGADGFRGGRKSKAYVDLYDAVYQLGERAVEQGWRKIEDPARISITRYAVTRAPRDSVNIGTAECNALTECGVWTDDAFGQTFSSSIVVDPLGPDRILIIVQRLTPIAPNPRTAAAPKRARVEAAKLPAAPHSGRTALIDGKPVPYEDALALLRGDAPARGHGSTRHRR